MGDLNIGSNEFPLTLASRIKASAAQRTYLKKGALAHCLAKYRNVWHSQVEGFLNARIAIPVVSLVPHVWRLHYFLPPATLQMPSGVDS
jgi:hypothetical protein